MRSYRVLSVVHTVGITLAGMAILIKRTLSFGSQPLTFQPTTLVFLLLYVVGDLLRVSLGPTSVLSLGFPWILLTLMTDGPPAALYVAVFGSLLSETLYSQFLANGRPLLHTSVRRALFVAAHHAVASQGAWLAYALASNGMAPWLVQEPHLQATVIYVGVYALLSMLLVWPHDYCVYRCLLPGEVPFARVDLLGSLLLTPLPVLALWLYNLQVTSQYIGPMARMLVIVLVLPALFVVFFLWVQDYIRTDEDRKRFELGERVRRALGTPRDLAELAERLFYATSELVSYRWGALYRRDEEVLVLVASREAGHDVVAAREGAPALADTGAPLWPARVSLGEGLVGQMALEREVRPRFNQGTSSAAGRDGVRLPERTALLPLGLRAAQPNGDGGGRSELISLVALGRPRRLFTVVDQERAQILCSQVGDVFLATRRWQDARQQFTHRIANHDRDPIQVRQATDELHRLQVDVPQILARANEQWNYIGWRRALAIASGQQPEQDFTLSGAELEEIYHTVRDEKPGMPPLTSHILDLVQLVVSSHTVPFDIATQPDELFWRAERQAVYAILSEAHKANSVARILALSSRLEAQIGSLGREPAGEGEALPDALLRALDGLLQVVHELGAFEVLRDLASKRDVLGRTLNVIDVQTDRVNVLLEDTERLVLGQVFKAWHRAVMTELLGLSKEPARLVLRLRNSHALPLDTIHVALWVRNAGPGVAYRVVAKLLPSAGYQVLEAKQSPGTIPVEGVRELEFALQPSGPGPLRLEFEVQYGDPERAHRTEWFADRFYLRESPPPFSRIYNPYMPGIPLRPGNPTFFGREDVFRYIGQSLDTITQTAILVLIGQRRTGKTSILQQLPAHLDPARYLCVFVDGNGLGIDPGMDNFFLSLMEDIVLGLERAGIPMPRVKPEELGDSPQRFFEYEFLRGVRAAIGDRTLLLTIDEFEELGARVKSGALPASVFSYVRHLIQHGDRLAFIFAGTHRIEEMIGDYWSVLFNSSIYRRIGFLQEDAARRLITEPVGDEGMLYDDLAVQEIVRLTAGHPYFTQLLCHVLVNHCNDDERNYVTIQSVREALDELLELGRTHLTYVWNTSDEGTRLCLAALADLRARMDQVTAAAIANRLGDYGLDLSPGEVHRAMSSLVARDLVVEAGSNPATYSLTAQLYAHWLRRYRQLSRVAER
jgi:hypothetical protein